MPPMFLLAGGGSLRGLARRALASRMASPLAAGLAEVQKRRRLSRYRRIIRQADPALTVSLLELTDLATPWSDNYTKPVDEAYVQANWQHHKPLFDLIEDLARRASPDRPPRVLEAGMGLGTMALALSRLNYRVWGIDSDVVQVARAQLLSRRLGGFARYFCMSIGDTCLLQPDSFDLVFSQGTLEHFDPQGLDDALRAELRLAPYVVISVPSVDWPGTEIGGERRLTTEDWRLALDQLGHEVLDLKYYGKARWHVLAAIKRRGYLPPEGKATAASAQAARNAASAT
jgi:SAM-dependent methyltransferase